MTLHFGARTRMRCQVLLAIASREDGRDNRRFTISSLEHRLFERSASRITRVQENGVVVLGRRDDIVA